MRKSVLCLLLLACSDTDGDGLNAGAERRHGTDPEVPDTDGDRLEDGAEVERGTDPLDADSDGDGYADGDEVTEGTDPLDADSVIYLGGWPYQHAKSSLVQGSLEGGARPGDSFPPFIAQDAFGDQVDVYDYALGGVPIMVQFCTPISVNRCGLVNDWLHRKDSHAPFSAYDPVRDAVEAGSLRWVTILTDLPGSDPLTDADVQTFDATYPGIVVLPDPGGTLDSWASQDLPEQRAPLYILLREDMRIQTIDSVNDPASGYTLYDLALSLVAEE